MSISSYNLGFPQNGSTLGQSKATIRNNLDGTFLTLSVNHYNQNTTLSGAAGKHLYIQMPVSDSPGSTGSTEIVLCNSPSSVDGSNNLYFIPPGYPGLGALIQMTRNEPPLTTGAGGVISGFSWLPGGILIQWGTYTVSSPSSTIPFGLQINFPKTFTNIYSVTLGGQSNSTNDKTINIITGSLTGAKFNVSTSGTSSFQALSWMAIGN